METIRDAVNGDFEKILALNVSEVRQTSALDKPGLESLVRLSAYCKVVERDGMVVGFVVALRESAPYENDNHAWFTARVPKFLYVDRIVVGSPFAGRGIGARLYDDVFAFARLHDVRSVTCEYNIDPPNPASRAFHDKFGFKEIGTRWTPDGTKQVSMQRADT